MKTNNPVSMSWNIGTKWKYFLTDSFHLNGHTLAYGFHQDLHVKVRTTLYNTIRIQHESTAVVPRSQTVVKEFLALPWHRKIQDFSIVTMPLSLTASWTTVPKSDHTIQTSSVDERCWIIPPQSDYPTLKKNQNWHNLNCVDFSIIVALERWWASPIK